LFRERRVERVRQRSGPHGHGYAVKRIVELLVEVREVGRADVPVGRFSAVGGTAVGFVG
jgi:hypothetical protein